ncbi:hypothetical protein M404DRAFT_994382 [Pisolithus tinctorius Marx 270]|uniref:Uncharacterized protein n=1 Tax=Pisolithus tinctorius Marx 270 TaxID=870435 RepID=A0A0C3KPV5_PISTI|nr:hypothetical protein M404DRAFT_994382 [Pisolithus tinctorius Marx 270]
MNDIGSTITPPSNDIRQLKARPWVSRTPMSANLLSSHHTFHWHYPETISSLSCHLFTSGRSVLCSLK